MKALVKTKVKKKKVQVPFDPVLFAATVPSRRPTAKDVADCKAHMDDAIEPREYIAMDATVEEL